MGLTTAIDDIRAGLSAEVMLPDDPGYDEARALHNAMIDKRPAVIARCRSATDIARALEFAQKSKLAVAVRGGGHNGPGFGSVDGGLVIDLSPMNRVDVDADRRTARVQGGATWGQVDGMTHAHGLATPAGIISTTGVGGLTLGGGHGYLTRKYGLTVDNLVEAELVLADGRVVTASESDHPDLFWALRGGGGNFGVVTSFTFRLHPVRTVVCGPTAWPSSATADILRWYRDFLPALDEDLYGFFATMTVPPFASFPEAFHLHKVCAVMWCYTGDPARTDEVFAPVRQMEPAFDGLGAAPYPALQSTFDGLYPKGLQWYWRGDFFRSVADGAVEAHAHFAETLPTMHSTMHLYPIDGAVHRVGQTETAWAYRDATFSQVIAGVDPDPANAALLKRWTAEYWDATHPYSAGGGYVNFMMDEGHDRVRATYGPNYQRLSEIKAQYDPSNVFHINQNIQPGGSTRLGNQSGVERPAEPVEVRGSPIPAPRPPIGPTPQPLPASQQPGHFAIMTLAEQATPAHFVTAVGGGGRTTDVVHTDAVTPGAWEKFSLWFVPSTGEYCIATIDGEFLSATNGGGLTGLFPIDGEDVDTVESTAGQITDYERFTLTSLPGDIPCFGIRTARGFYLTAVGGGGKSDPPVFHTDATKASSWETFMLLKSDDPGSGYTYGITPVLDAQPYPSAGPGPWLTASNGGGEDGSGGPPVTIGPLQPPYWLAWTLQRQSDGSYAFQTASGYYLTAIGGGSPGEGWRTDTPRVTNWEKFTLVPNNDCTYYLQTYNGYYLGVGQGVPQTYLDIGAATKWQLWVFALAPTT